MKDKITEAIRKITGEKDISLESPENPDFGDYSTNVALQITGKIKKKAKFESSWDKLQLNDNSRDNAKRIVRELVKDKELMKVVDEAAIAGPGFINFKLKTHVLLDILSNIYTHNDNFGYSDNLKGKRIVVEYTDPNPFKEFHVGHLYSNTVGESICRLLSSQGATIWRADYFGDVGMHVAKAIWGLLEKFKENKLTLKELEKKDLKDRIKYLGQAYAKGATAYEKNKDVVEDTKHINFLVFKAAQEVVLPTFSEEPQVNYDQYIKQGKYNYDEIKDIYSICRGWSMEYFESIYKRVGMSFDGYYPESRTGEYGYGMVLDGLEKGIFEKGDGGAIIFPGEKYGLHNRVFINALGLPTYEAKDFGNAVAKYKDFPYDMSVIVTGNEINEYFVVVLRALSMYKKELAEATTHVGHGMVRLPEGKMSSRTGKIIRGEWVLDEARERIKKIVQKSDVLESSTEVDKEQTAEIVAQAAIKYAFLRQGIGNNIAFDFDTSLSFEGNSGPYLQYTYARAKSVLEKVNQKATSAYDFSVLKQKMNSEELLILRTLVHFQEIVSEAAERYTPNLVCNFLFDLAQKFNNFYAKYRISDEEDSDIRSFRLNLTGATAQVIKNGLSLLGIMAPDKM
jgi:arginyl-tRNA synthetase